MSNNIDFQKSFDSVKTLMEMQAAAISKSVELQKQSGEQLASFFQTEAEKAKGLKTPEDVVKFNIDANTALFELLKAQGEAFTTLAKEAGESAMAEVTKLAK
ncbi:hypothetical protein [Amphritea balenae]|uniref:Phasin family protein n=1 Tax=Amphritea balenae TaxID=452629 RepID=A0A3P1SV83_9GAMM|nr:hypothetical protein [Amphritea balenae]RRD01020.1 hypothetical protein EHS89_00165 [Amphritea balenae]GGK60653.1 hypothetical protein GCM10007941_08630 [Amphritea balenae]